MKQYKLRVLVKVNHSAVVIGFRPVAAVLSLWHANFACPVSTNYLINRLHPAKCDQPEKSPCFSEIHLEWITACFKLWRREVVSLFFLCSCMHCTLTGHAKQGVAVTLTLWFHVNIIVVAVAPWRINWKKTGLRGSRFCVDKKNVLGCTFLILLNSKSYFQTWDVIYFERLLHTTHSTSLKQS